MCRFGWTERVWIGMFSAKVGGRRVSVGYSRVDVSSDGDRYPARSGIKLSGNLSTSA